MATSKPVRHIIADSGAFIRNAPLREIGEAVYTVPEVVKEIRDRATRDRLQVLPYKLLFKEPSGDAIKFVSDFARKTGDYGALSHVDLKVLALTYQLEREKVGADHIKKEPDSKKEITVTSWGLDKASDVAGFYVPKPKKLEESQNAVVVRTEDLREEEGDQGKESADDPAEVPEEPSEGESREGKVEEEEEEHMDSCTEGGVEEGGDPVVDSVGEDGDCSEKEKEEEEEEEDGDEDAAAADDDDEDDDDNDEGWITPSNIKEVTKGNTADVEKANVAVGCLTTDFAIQNVLIQMGLNVISVDGMLIKRARSYAKRCYSCMKITTDVSRNFCPFCGYKTLHRISMTVADDGSVQYHMPKRIVRTRRVIPPFKGGKYSNNPIITEDQPVPHQRLSKKAMQRLNVMEMDFVAGSSPFATRDTTSRAAKLGMGKNPWNKRDPSAVLKKGRRK